ncbi:hybrid sensor histidine kinase/response regulator [Pedobacter glucosidilyticus]|uniref:hybrid sensor histidine kinase/response regulator n=1 Tax=Pedobacter glucosidilyticus TaxID=1122941 RepID=UPI00047C7702|nr:hybrid sensor histidine kinase/response regulator transcription factor [Pedobacter glucosidilyticus]
MRSSALIFLFFSFVFFFDLEDSFSAFKDTKFNYLKVEDGLSSNRIKCILRDSRGFVWIGTYMGGLNRFDGSNVTVFEHTNDSRSISNNYINALYEDSNNNLWVGTNAGLNLYNRKSESFKKFNIQISHNKSLSSIRINNITSDKYGNLWIATEFGLLKRDSKTGKFIQFILHKGRNFIDEITDLVIDNKECLWLSNNKGEIISFNTKTSEIKTTRVPIYNRNKNISKVKIDKYGLIWLGTSDNGLFSYNPESNEFQSYNPSKGLQGKDIRGMEISGNYLLLAIDHGGLVRINILTKEVEYCFSDEKIENSLNTNSLWAVYIDKEGILYVGTFNGGVNIYNPKKERFKSYFHKYGDSNSLVNNSVRAIMEDSKGIIWIGTDGGGISLFNPKNNSFQNFKSEKGSNKSISSNAVLSIVEDADGDIWLATWGGGINRYDRKSKRFITYNINLNNAKALQNDKYYDIELDNKGLLWLSSFSEGVVIFDKNKGVLKRIGANILPSTTISNIRLQVDGTMGIITQKGYVYHDEKTGFHTLEALRDLNLNDVYLDEKGVYWICTNDAGLWELKPNGYINKHNQANGFISNSVVGIIPDAQSNKWVLTTKGLVFLNAKTGKYQSFTVADGLKGNEFSRIAYLKAKDNSLYFGGLSGFIKINPNNIKINNYIPPVYINEFNIFNKKVIPAVAGSPLKQSILETEEITLSYKNSVFTLGFHALNLTHPEKTQYAYMMVGYDKSWNYTTADRSYATYTNLDPNTYIFSVKATNNDGVWNQTPKQIKITITPPFWKTWWAYLIYLGCIVLIFTIILRYSHNQIKIKNERIQAEKLNEIAQMKLRFFTNISHEFKTPLALLSGPISKLIRSGEEITSEQKQVYYNIIERNVKELQNLISQLLDMRKLDSGALKLEICYGNITTYIKNLFDVFVGLADDRNIVYEFEAPEENIDGFFDPDKLDKIVRNLLSNAFKFTNNIVKLKIYKEESILNIIVEDNGIGITSENRERIFDQFFQIDDSKTRNIGGTGIGLSLVKELLALYSGSIKVESEPNRGSSFMVSLPTQSEDFGNKVILLDKVDSQDTFKDYKEEKLILDDATAKQDKHSILIVEDNEDMLVYMESLFTNKYKVFKAQNGLLGYQLALEHLPAIIITDVMMPELDGIQLTSKLKTDERTSHIPIILLTALSSLKHRIQGYEIGADDYIDKPFNDELLIVRVTNLLKSRQQAIEKFDKSIDVNPKEISLNVADQKFLQKALDVVEKNIEDYEFTTKDFISEMAMSRTQLNNKIKALTGKTIHEFIKSVQLKKAAQYLLTGEYNLSQVCYKVGFANYVSFYNNFKDYFGVIPSNFMEQNSDLK